MDKRSSLADLFTSPPGAETRKVPGLGDIPILGHLFRYDTLAKIRKEFLIILTPHIIRNRLDAEEAKALESARMNWCLSGVEKLHGDLGLPTKVYLGEEPETIRELSSKKEIPMSRECRFPRRNLRHRWKNLPDLRFEQTRTIELERIIFPRQIRLPRRRKIRTTIRLRVDRQFKMPFVHKVAKVPIKRRRKKAKSRESQGRQAFE